MPPGVVEFPPLTWQSDNDYAERRKIIEYYVKYFVKTYAHKNHWRENWFPAVRMTARIYERHRYRMAVSLEDYKSGNVSFKEYSKYLLPREYRVIRKVCSDENN